MPRRGRARAAAVLPVVLSAVLLAGGCGSAGQANPEKYPPTGVDELVIPTPSPDPADFVSGIDNPWLPYVAGTVWTYDVTGSAASRQVVTVEDRTEQVAGVACTVVRRTDTDADGEVVADTETYYAQDREGNVWTFGELVTHGNPARSWRAGEGGAEAGLAMATRPRVGDGYLQQAGPGVLMVRSSVVSLDEEVTVPAGTFGGTLLIEDTAGDVVLRRSYAEGAGLVEESAVVGDTRHLALASVATP